MQSESKQPAGGGGAGAVLAVVAVLLLLLPVFYVLAIGPLVWLHDREMMSGTVLEVVEVVYSPLSVAHEYTWVQQPLDWYISLWESTPPPTPAVAAPAMAPPTPAMSPPPAAAGS